MEASSCGQINRWAVVSAAHNVARARFFAALRMTVAALRMTVAAIRMTVAALTVTAGRRPVGAEAGA
jgi:hypothetical protein